MAIYGQQITHTWSASVDLDSYQYYFVRAASASGDAVALCATATAPYPLGVLQNKPKAGEEAEVCLFGISKVRACTSAAFGIGDFLTAGTAGRAEYLAAACAIHAVALEPLAAGGSAIIWAFILPPGMRMIADQVYP